MSSSLGYASASHLFAARLASEPRSLAPSSYGGYIFIFMVFRFFVVVICATYITFSSSSLTFYLFALL
jgi:hypothetical protein